MSFYLDILKRRASRRPAATRRASRSCRERRTWTVSTTLFCASLISTALLLAACSQTRGDYGFAAQSVSLQPGYQTILASLRQDLKLSRDAVEALEHGVPLSLRVEMELRDSETLTLLAGDFLRYELRYMPLSEHYELRGPDSDSIRTYPRLRHALGALSSLRLALGTGALAPGHYEFRVRTRLDNARLPAPMRLPVLFSAQWRHDSEWSTWPFRIGA